MNMDKIWFGKDSHLLSDIQRDTSQVNANIILRGVSELPDMRYARGKAQWHRMRPPV